MDIQKYFSSSTNDNATAVFGGGHRKGQFYFDRPLLAQAIKSALRAGKHVILYGPPRQGKTAIYNNCLQIKDVCYIEGSDEPKRKEVYRILLSFLGYSITVEKKKKKKYGMNVGIKMFSSSLGGEGGGEVETTTKQLEMDIGNPSEIAHLIAEIGKTPIVVINNFQCLPKNTQKDILRDMCFFYESSDIQFVLIGSWQDEIYLERICPQISASIYKIPVNYWSEAELIKFGEHCNKFLDHPIEDKVYRLAAVESGGDIDTFCRLCLLFLRMAEQETVYPDKPMEIFSEACGNYRYEWFRTLYMSKLCELAAHEDLAAEYQITVDKEISAPVKDGDGEIALDDDGKEIYETKTVSENESYYSYIGAWLLRHCLEINIKSKSYRFPIEELCKAFSDEVLAKANYVNKNRLKRIFQDLTAVQRELNIVPQFFSLEAKDSVLVVSNPNFLLFLNRIDKDEFLAIVDDYIEDLPVLSVRRRNRIWREN